MDLGYFLSFTVVNGDVTKRSCIYLFLFLLVYLWDKHIPRSGIAESKHKCICNLLDIAKFSSIAIETLCIPIDNIQEPDSPWHCQRCMSTNLDDYQSDE